MKTFVKVFAALFLLSCLVLSTLLSSGCSNETEDESSLPDFTRPVSYPDDGELVLPANMNRRIDKNGWENAMKAEQFENVTITFYENDADKTNKEVTKIGTYADSGESSGNLVYETTTMAFIADKFDKFIFSEKISLYTARIYAADYPESDIVDMEIYVGFLDGKLDCIKCKRLNEENAVFDAVYFTDYGKTVIESREE
jgi:hypothetical protein